MILRFRWKWCCTIWACYSLFWWIMNKGMRFFLNSPSKVRRTVYFSLSSFRPPLSFYLCNPVKSAGGRTLGMTDRPIIVCPSAPRKSSFVSKILSPSPFCIILNLDFRSGNGRTDEMVMWRFFLHNSDQSEIAKKKQRKRQRSKQHHRNT